MAHGLTGDKSEHGYFDRVAEELNQVGYNVLTFDFTGRGESEGETIRIRGQIEDLETAISYLESKYVDRMGL